MRERMLQVVWRCLDAEARLFARGAPTSRLREWPGVTASIVPAAPDRSMFSWVIAPDPIALPPVYDEIAQAYADAGVRAFSVWVDETDATTKAMLAARGHAFDGAPRAMYGELAAMALVESGPLECRETDDVGIVARLNDIAYGFPPPAFTAALSSGVLGGGWHAYEARVEGVAVGCVLTWEGPAGDVGVTAVATHPDARGQQIASRLLSFALRSARDRGMRTTTLQASSKGKGLYARLGYQDVGALEMWEHRVPKPA